MCIATVVVGYPIFFISVALYFSVVWQPWKSNNAFGMDLDAAIWDPSELTCFGFTEEHYLFEILSDKEPVVKVE
ncbi:hypothetical protein [Halobacillus salinus]|uniref:Uncharacterized protein n=1 Tax=Halobacillus salinus TaxID=192814 RepID=A0A4Z0H3G0_9BACI|nr:hypothetical protein [Halobacillus salinus]TGB04932.1 hypothetical protein E4663_08040 [Halobacillus salinus]